ncbi:nuclear transport factor 2 family protein [Rhodococcus koreensis]
MSDIETRLRKLEDRAELHDLAVRYFLASDFDDLDVIADSFSVDGTFSTGGFPGASGGAGIAEMIRQARESFGTTIHTPNYVLVDFVDDDHATGVVGAHLEIATGGTTVFGAVRYEDEYVRVDGRWKFASRNMRTVHLGPWGEVASSLTSPCPVRWPGAEPAASDYAVKA